MVLSQLKAWIATILLIGLICFQLLLALGFPLGKAAWGGKYAKLPAGLRIASFAAVGFLSFSAACTLEKSGIAVILNDPRIVSYTVWVFSAYFALNTILNLVSKSRLEKIIMTQIALMLCILYLIVSFTS